MGEFFGTIKAAVQDFIDDECLSSGASLAYYTIFALPPLLVLVFFIAGLFGVSNQKVQEVVSRQVGIPIPEQPKSNGANAELARDEQDNAESGMADADDQQTTAGGGAAAVAQRTQSGIQPMKALGPVSKVIGVLILIFSATGLFAQLQTALNKAWEVEPDPTRGWTSFLMKRVLSLGMVIVIAFLLLVSLVLTTLVDEIVSWTVGQSAGPMGTSIGMVLNNGIALVMATLLFAAMYKLLPDANMRWRDLWAGSVITAILFVIGKELIGWYLRQSDIGSAWGGAAASMVAFLVWVYYSSLIVLLGAELTQVWAKNYGHGIQPEEGAVRVVHEKRHIRGAPAS
ncbi:MAG: YihY/virulence factor BrkB family protein [Pirellulaceae bacterium]